MNKLLEMAKKEEKILVDSIKGLKLSIKEAEDNIIRHKRGIIAKEKELEVLQGDMKKL